MFLFMYYPKFLQTVVFKVEKPFSVFYNKVDNKSSKLPKLRRLFFKQA